MTFEETKLSGAFVIGIDRISDARGFFARTWCAKEFEEYGLNTHLVQANISFNKNLGTLRGMHYQVAPFEETKLVRCTKGAIYDAIVDLRPHSSTYKQWFALELTSENHKMLYVPEGFAHGFQTLQDDTEVTYHVTQFYAPEYERGIRYNDPMVGIKWPIGVDVISDKDNAWPPYKPGNALEAGGGEVILKPRRSAAS